VQLRLPGTEQSFSLHEVQAFGWEVDPDCNDVCYLSNDGHCDDGGYGSTHGLCDEGTDCSDCGTIEGRERRAHAYKKLPFPPPPPAGPSFSCSCDETCYWDQCNASCDDHNDSCNRQCSRRRRNDYLGCDHGCSAICRSSCDSNDCTAQECGRFYGVCEE